MGSEQFLRASKWIWKFELLPWTRSLFECPLHPPHPHSAKHAGQVNSVWGSAYCSASLRAADYDHNKCQALKVVDPSFSTSVQFHSSCILFCKAHRDMQFCLCVLCYIKMFHYYYHYYYYLQSQNVRLDKNNGM